MHMTTNGTLIDEPFLIYAREAGPTVALSLDGTKPAHDAHRKTASGEGTFDRVSPALDLLLKHRPYAGVFMTVSPETVGRYAESVEYLLGRGVRYLIVSLNYAGAWTGAHLKTLRKQYVRLAQIYERLTLVEKKLYATASRSRPMVWSFLRCAPCGARGAFQRLSCCGRAASPQCPRRSQPS